jgi:hypothetical protein
MLPPLRVGVARMGKKRRMKLKINMKTYEGPIFGLLPHQIFVFGSNTQGRHGKGAALVALKNFGAKYGQSKGLQGQSYAIMTKDLNKEFHPSIDKDVIEAQIRVLYMFAENHPNKEFYVAYSGTGTNLNGYTPQQMARMFAVRKPPENMVFEIGFAQMLEKFFMEEDFIKDLEETERMIGVLNEQDN